MHKWNRKDEIDLVPIPRVKHEILVLLCMNTLTFRKQTKITDPSFLFFSNPRFPLISNTDHIIYFTSPSIKQPKIIINEMEITIGFPVCYYI